MRMPLLSGAQPRHPNYPCGSEPILQQPAPTPEAHISYLAAQITDAQSNIEYLSQLLELQTANSKASAPHATEFLVATPLPLSLASNAHFQFFRDFLLSHETLCSCVLKWAHA